MKRNIFGAFVMTVALFAAAGVSYAQAPQSAAMNAEYDKNLELMRKDLKSNKKQIIAANMPLTDVEATKFWPLYDQYVADMSKQYDLFYLVIKDYAANQATLTDTQAISMIKRWGEIQADQVKVKQKYIAAFEKVIPGKKTALFFQIDRRLYMLMDLQVASEIPLVIQP